MCVVDCIHLYVAKYVVVVLLLTLNIPFPFTLIFVCVLENYIVP